MLRLFDLKKLVLCTAVLVSTFKSVYIGSIPEKLPLVVVKTESIPIESSNWVQGVALYGLLNYYDATGDKKILEYVTNTVDKMMNLPVPSYPPPDGFNWVVNFVPDDPNYIRTVNIVPLGITLINLYKQTGNKAYLDKANVYAQGLINWINNKDETASNGAIYHFYKEVGWYPENQLDTVWVDSVYMTCIFLANMYKVTGDINYLDLSVKQLLAHVEVLKDREKGLYYHAYDDSDRDNWGLFWSRGNGWMLDSLIDIYELCPDSFSQKAIIKDEFVSLAKSLITYQDGTTGLWHQIVDHSETFLETSGSQMFAYAFLKGYRLGLLSGDYLSSGLKTFNYIYENKILADGWIDGICISQGPSDNVADYDSCNHQLPPPSQYGDVATLHGQGTFLNLASEYLKYKASLDNKSNTSTLPDTAKDYTDIFLILVSIGLIGVMSIILFINIVLRKKFFK